MTKMRRRGWRPLTTKSVTNDGTESSGWTKKSPWPLLRGFFFFFTELCRQISHIMENDGPEADYGSTMLPEKNRELQAEAGQASWPPTIARLNEGKVGDPEGGGKKFASLAAYGRGRLAREVNEPKIPPAKQEKKAFFRQRNRRQVCCHSPNFPALPPPPPPFLPISMPPPPISMGVLARKDLHRQRAQLPRRGGVFFFQRPISFKRNAPLRSTAS